MISEILSRDGIDRLRVFHLIDWCSHKPSHVGYSPYGAEIISAATTEDRVYYLQIAVNTLFAETADSGRTAQKIYPTLTISERKFCKRNMCYRSIVAGSRSGIYV